MHDSRLSHTDEDFSHWNLSPDLVLVRRLDYTTMFDTTTLALPEEYMYEGYCCLVEAVGPSKEYPKIVSKGDTVIVFQGVGHEYGKLAIIHVGDIKARVRNA